MVHTVSKKIETYGGKPLDDGDCVEVEAVFGGTGRIIREVGIILSHELVEMDDDLCEYLYKVHSPIGIDDYWAYEVKLVNSTKSDYNNNITHNRR